MTDSKTPPKYDVSIVEAVILEMAAELHPRNLPAKELWLRIVGDASDAREIETAARATRNLYEFGLLADREDEILEPTPAALRAVALLA